MIYFWTLRVCDVDGCRLDGGRVVPYLRVAPQQPFAVYVMCPPAGGCNSTSAGRLKLVRPSAANDLPSWHPLEGCSEAPEAAEVVWEAGAGQEDSERLDYRAWDSRRRLAAACASSRSLPRVVPSPPLLSLLPLAPAPRPLAPPPPFLALFPCFVSFSSCLSFRGSPLRRFFS